MIFMYMTPEVVFPMVSAVAAAVGFILLVGRTPFRIAAHGFRYTAKGFRYASRRIRSLVDKLDL
jgi:hypothetical protein